MRERRCGGGDGPEDERAEDDGFARQAVAEPSGEGAEEGVDHHEGGADDAELDVGEAELLLDEWKDGEDCLAIRVVERSRRTTTWRRPAICRS